MRPVKVLLLGARIKGRSVEDAGDRIGYALFVGSLWLAVDFPPAAWALVSWPTYSVSLVRLLFLLFPHFNQQPKAFVVALCILKVIERLHEHLAYTSIPARAEQLLGDIDKLLVHVASKSGARVVREDAYQHNGIVLERGLAPIVTLEELANDAGTFGRRRGRGLGRIDNWGEEGDVVALEKAMPLFSFNSLGGKTHNRVTLNVAGGVSLFGFRLTRRIASVSHCQHMASIAQDGRTYHITGGHGLRRVLVTVGRRSIAAAACHGEKSMVS